MALSIVFFDLDGTLVDARDAAWEIFADTNALFELGIDTQEKFLALSETNIFSALSECCVDEQHATTVIDHFMNSIRERYNPPFIPGMVDVVKQFNAQTSLAILSSNMGETIRRILEAGGIAEYFPHILSGDDEPSKRTAITNFLAANDDQFAKPLTGEERQSRRSRNENAALITDTVGDVGEALGGGIRVCGVSWGMHSREQLLRAGAEYVADTPPELIQWFNKARFGANGRS